MMVKKVNRILRKKERMTMERKKIMIIKGKEDFEAEKGKEDKKENVSKKMLSS